MFLKNSKYYIIITILILLNIYVLGQNKYALVIGISGYPNFNEKNKLKYADEDAIAFASFVQTNEGGRFPQNNVKLITNENASREGISNGIQWLKRRSNSDDLVYIFFAGHGLVDDAGQAYFMPYEGNQNNPSAMGFRADRFLEDIKTQVNYKQLIFFIDACHAGAIYNDGIATARESDQNIISEMNDTWDDLFNGQQEITMAFLSSASNERSHEDPSIEHGLFTYFLIKGLNGDADGKYGGIKDNKVTAIELYLYLLNNVEDYAHDLGKVQTPTKSPIFVPEFPFSYNPYSLDTDDGIMNYETAYSYYVKGTNLSFDQNYHKAIEMFNKAIEVDSKYADAYHGAAWCYYKLGNCQKSKEYIESAIKYDPRNYSLFHMLGFYFGECTPHDFNKAYEYTLKAHELNASDQVTSNNLAYYRMFIGKNRFSNELADETRKFYDLRYFNKRQYYYSKDFSDTDKYCYLQANFISTLNYLILQDKSSFERYYSNVIRLYNYYQSITSQGSYESIKLFTIQSSSLKNYEKELILQLCNLFAKEKSKSAIDEFNLSIPSQYINLEKPHWGINLGLPMK